MGQDRRDRPEQVEESVSDAMVCPFYYGKSQEISGVSPEFRNSAELRRVVAGYAPGRGPHAEH